MTRPEVKKALAEECKEHNISEEQALVKAKKYAEEIAAHFVVGTHGSTYGGNPLATAVAFAVINEIILW